MTEENEVQVEGERKRRLPWGLGALYHMEGDKAVVRPRSVMWAAIGFFTITSVASLFNVEVDSGLAGRGIIIGIEQGGQQIANVPVWPQKDLPTGGAAATKGKAGKRRTGGSHAGLELVRRSDDASIPPGSVVKARLITGASNGPVRAEVVEPLSVDGGTRLAVGTVLLGSGQSSEERLFIRFSQAVLRDGSAFRVEAQALDSGDQIAGLKGTLVNHELARLGASAGLNFAGGLSAGLEDSQAQNGVAVTKPSLRNGMLNGAAQAAIEEARDVMNNLKMKSPVIEVPAGQEIFVLFGQGS